MPNPNPNEMQQVGMDLAYGDDMCVMRCACGKLWVLVDGKITVGPPSGSMEVPADFIMAEHRKFCPKVKR